LKLENPLLWKIVGGGKLILSPKNLAVILGYLHFVVGAVIFLREHLLLRV
jgi:hypothetical protein